MPVLELTRLAARRVPPAELRTAGAAAPGPLWLRVLVMAGAQSDRRRDGLVADLTAAVPRADGAADDPDLRVRVLVDELPDGGWRAGASTWPLARLQDRARTEPAL